MLGYPSQASLGYLIALDVWLFLTVLFANFATALAEARGKAQADALRKTRQETPAYRLRDNGEIEETVSTDSEGRRPRRGRGRPGHPRRRRDRRGRRLGGRVGHHRRVGPGDPRGRRRPLRRHRRHARAVRPHRRAHHRRRRQVVPRPHDRPGRRGHPPAHAQRDRPVAGAVGVHADLPDRHRGAVADGLQRRAVHEGLPRRRRAGQEPGHRRADAGGPAGLPDPDDHRRPAGGHRHRRHGPGPAGQHHRQERQGGRGGRRRGHAAAGQDRHHHDRQPPGDAVRAARRLRGRARSAELAALASVADQTPEGKSIVELYRKPAGRRPALAGDAAGRGALRRVHRPDAHERHRPARRPAHPQGGADAVAPPRPGSRAARCPPGCRSRWTRSPSQGATPLLVCEGNRIAGLVVLEDILKPGIARALRAAAAAWACAR